MGSHIQLGVLTWSGSHLTTTTPRSLAGQHLSDAQNREKELHLFDDCSARCLADAQQAHDAAAPQLAAENSAQPISKSLCVST